MFIKKSKINIDPSEVLAAYHDTNQLRQISTQVLKALYHLPYFKRQVRQQIKVNKLGDIALEDLMAETLYTVQVNLLAKNYSGGDICAYAIGIAKYKAKNLKKKASFVPEAFPQKEMPTSTLNEEERKISEEEDDIKKRTLLSILKNCLTENQINLLIECKVEGIPHKDLAVTFGYKSEKSSKAAVYDAVKKLKRHIEENPNFKKLLAEYSILKIDNR